MPTDPRLVQVSLEEEMRVSYLDYAMSVIVGRALPDVRDGLKPVHRRILYAMFREGLLASRRYSKCAGVVGEVIKKYHPHGDTAVYDALVRMAQDFNMRYPLVDGQGNFGCFSGSTRVRLADGTTRSFEELAEDDAAGQEHFTYTVDETGRIIFAPIQAPRLTKRQAPVVRVILDNHEEIVCTPDHRFMLRRGGYKEARALEPGEALMPLYSRVYEGSDANLQGYEEIYQPALDTWEFAHHVADEYNLATGLYARSAGRVRHHADFNKLNNDPSNIVRMSWGEHRRVHMRRLGEMWTDGAFRRRMSKMLSDQWRDPEFRRRTIAAIGEENRRRWRDPEFRSRCLAALQVLWADPDFRQRILSRALERNVLLHGTPEQKAAMTAAQRQALQRMWNDPDYVAWQRKQMQGISRRLWADPNHRQRITALARKQWEDPRYRAVKSSEAKKLWADPAYRATLSRYSAERWRDPAYRAKHAGHLSANGHKTVHSRYLAICKRAIEKDGALTPEGYERERHATGIHAIIRFEQGLEQFFHGDRAALHQASRAYAGQLNHKVVSVEPAGYADVYDLTVDGSHNFALAAGVFVHNSVDGDPPAAYRYTEARLTKLAEEMLADIDLDTVDFAPNYDESTTEPTVLPTRVPTLLINGSSGIAVGMATNMPTHNLGEVIDGLLLLLDDPEASAEAVMEVITGPDFPTAGFICGRHGIHEAYRTGRGTLIIRGRAVAEVHPKTERESIIITELPYQVNKARLIEKMAELVRDRKVEGISDLRDESGREGMRIVIELKRGETAAVVLNQLYRHTQLQTTFGVIMLAIVDGRPQVLTLKALLVHFLDFRREVVLRRTRFELRKAEEKAHILEGLKNALDHLDAVIALIKGSRSPEAARDGLIQRFGMSEIQAQAVLDMKLQRLTGLERDKLRKEYQETIERIAYLNEVLMNAALVKKIIADELRDVKEKYQDARRTEIIAEASEINPEDMIAAEDMAITISHAGYIKRNPATIYRSQRRGGKGKLAMGTKEEDFVERLFVASTHNSLLFFTDAGRVYWLKVHELPEAGRAAKGKAVVNLIQMAQGERLTAVLPVAEFREDLYIVMATKQGVIKKTPLEAYSNPRAGGIIALTLDEGDRLIAAQLTDGSREVLLGTRRGFVIRFREQEARPMGRTSRGVKGITLRKDDEVIGMEVVRDHSTILMVTERGYGKRTQLSAYRLQARGGMGIIGIRTGARNGAAVAALQVSEDQGIMLMAAEGKVIRLQIKDVRVIGRATQGVRLIGITESDRVVAVAPLAEDDENGGSADNGNPAGPPEAA